MDVDIGSSYTACSVVNLVKGATKSLVMNFGILVEGQHDDELPERLVGAINLGEGGCSSQISSWVWQMLYVPFGL